MGQDGYRLSEQLRHSGAEKRRCAGMQVYNSDDLPTFSDWITGGSAKTTRRALIVPLNHFGVVDIVIADVGLVTPNGDLSGAESQEGSRCQFRYRRAK